MARVDLRSEGTHSPTRDRIQLIRVFIEVSETVLKVIIKREVETPGNGCGADAKHGTTCVDDGHVPGFAAVVGGAVGSNEGLAFVLVHEVEGDVCVVWIEGVGVDEEVEDGGEDGDGTAVDVEMHAGEKGMVE